jgi:hypothetical protein
VDNDAAQQHLMDSMRAQQTLMDMSDQPHRDPWRAMMTQAYRARSGQDEGISYLTCPF